MADPIASGERLTRPETCHGRSRRDEEVSMAQLIRRVAVLDRVAFAALYDVMSSGVRGQALAAMSSGSAVDAVVAATFLHVWWLAPSYNPNDANVHTWVRAIAAARIADRRRDAVPASSDAGADAQPAPWSALSRAYDETVAVVLAGLLGRTGLRKAF